MTINKSVATFSFVLVSLFSVLFLLSFSHSRKVVGPPFDFPYEAAGLTQREAAAHLISRFTYGARPGQIDEVIKTGLESWFQQQLAGSFLEDSLTKKLSAYDAMQFSNTEMIAAFPKPLHVLRMAAAEGIIPSDSIKKIDNKAYRKLLADFTAKKGFRQQSDLIRQFISQRITRATYSNNQLQEVLTGFWFNHFNVSLTRRETVLLLPSYERDAIRPHVTGHFESLLLATAQSPAMIYYLDNFSNAGSPENIAWTHRPASKPLPGKALDSTALLFRKFAAVKKNQGLNENYAREVMELHTLGVDGGYTQQDVTQAARILTGWTVYPIGEGYSPDSKRLIDAVEEKKLYEYGFVRKGDFFFAMNRHDKKEKTVLGKKFPANGGYEEGVALLEMLAKHPSTATFICQKLATYFVSDQPPKSLVDKMAQTFLKTNGHIKEVLITMVQAPEFWDRSVIRQKIKSPFELAISAARALDASIEMPYQMFARIDKMGQKIYYFAAPTGFPDRAQYWINTGALLNRMNFGLDIAAQQVRGVKVNLLQLNNNHEPESATAALATYAALLLPERDISATIKRLTPLLNDPVLNKKVERAANITKKTQQRQRVNEMEEEEGMEKEEGMESSPSEITLMRIPSPQSSAQWLAQVVGIIIGSPEFQRR